MNAVALIEEDPREGNSAVSGGHMTDCPKSDGVTAEHSCPVRRVRMSAVSVAKAVCRVPGPRGVWWGWPSTEVRPLSLASLSPRREVKAVWPSPSFGTNDSSWTHGLKGDNLPDILEEDNISNTDVYSTEIIYRKNVLLLH